MPRDLNEPPPLNPNPPQGYTEHLDNTNLNSDKNPEGFKTLAAAGQDKDSGSGSNLVTLTVNGDFDGSAQVPPRTLLMEGLNKVNGDFKSFNYTRVDGSAVKPDALVEGDMTVTAKKK